MQLGFTLSTFPEIVKLKEETKPMIYLWMTIEEFDSVIEGWKIQPLYQIKVDGIDNYCIEWTRKLSNCMRDKILS